MSRAPSQLVGHPSAGVASTPAWRAVLRDAMQAHQAGRLDTAEPLYRKVLALRVGQPDAMHFLGVLRHQLGHSREAVELIEGALAVDPQHADAHNNLGNVHKECGRLAEAEACYRRALSCKPGHADALSNLALVLEAQGRLPEAFITHASLLQVAPDDARAHYLMGVFLREHPESREHVEQAVELFRRAWKLDPRLLVALHELGATLYALDRTDEARAVYREWLERDPGNPVPRHMLAASGGAAVPARAADDYVRTTFDNFADSFDAQLLTSLHYRAPRALADLLATALPPPAAALDILDAGCGTGLCGPLLRPYARKLDGVDLSPGMVEKARQRGGYDELVVAELTAFLALHPNRWDVIVSADTLVYFGDLAPIAATAYKALRPGGWLAISLEAGAGEGFGLGASGRYWHSRAYVERTLRAARFVAIDIRADQLRREAGRPVDSWVVLARHAEGAGAMAGSGGRRG